jgi:2-haloacid dehalogenase
MKSGPTKLNRREFVALGVAGVALGAIPSIPSVFAGEPFSKSRIRAIAFDAFPIFDPRPVFALAQKLFPVKGAELAKQWRMRQFEYTWLRATAQKYADFWRVTQDALEYAAEELDLTLDREQRDELMNAYLKLRLWPDVLPALASLKKSDLRLAFLSNFTPRMLEANIKHAGLSGFFEQPLSTDAARTYKPDPRAYELGIKALKLERREILFVAFAGWDAAGAKLFGYPTFWVNRQKFPAEKLDATPDGSGESLTQLVHFLT